MGTRTYKRNTLAGLRLEVFDRRLMPLDIVMEATAGQLLFWLSLADDDVELPDGRRAVGHELLRLLANGYSKDEVSFDLTKGMIRRMLAAKEEEGTQEG